MNVTVVTKVIKIRSKLGSIFRVRERDPQRFESPVKIACPAA